MSVQNWPVVMLSLEDYLPQLGRLKAALDCQTAEDSEPLLADLKNALEQLYSQHVEELQFLAPPDPQYETAELIGEGFVEVFTLLGPLEEEIQTDLSLASETADTLTEALESLYPLFKRYITEYQQSPRYSEVPYTHELVRVCRHFLQGYLSREAVLIRLDQFTEFHEHLESELKHARPSGAEQKTMDCNSEDLTEALQAQAEGIADLEEALLNPEPSAETVEGCMDVLTTSAEILVDIYRQLHRAETEPRQVPCIRCSEPNPSSARTCGNCGAALPSGAVISDEPTSTVAFEEDGSLVQSSQSEEIENLQSAIDHFARTGELERLTLARSELVEKLGRVERRYERLSRRRSSETEEQGSQLFDARQAFLQGLDLMRQALQFFHEGEQTEDLVRLEAGVEKMREANESFQVLRVCMDSLRGA